MQHENIIRLEKELYARRQGVNTTFNWKRTESQGVRLKITFTKKGSTKFLGYESKGGGRMSTKGRGKAKGMKERREGRWREFLLSIDLGMPLLLLLSSSIVSHSLVVRMASYLTWLVKGGKGTVSYHHHNGPQECCKYTVFMGITNKKHSKG